MYIYIYTILSVSPITIANVKESIARLIRRWKYNTNVDEFYVITEDRMMHKNAEKTTETEETQLKDSWLHLLIWCMSLLSTKIYTANKISWWYPCGLTLFWCNWLHCFFDSITSSLFPLALHQLRLLLTWTVACIFYYRQIVWIMASIHTLPLRTRRQRMPHRVWAAWMWTSLKWTHLRKWWGKRTASLCVFNCHPS